MRTIIMTDAATLGAAVPHLFALANKAVINRWGFDRAAAGRSGLGSGVLSREADPVGGDQPLEARVARLERELAEAKAALSAKPIVDRAQLFALTDAMPVLVSVIGRDQRYEFANRAYENWFGPEVSDVVGRHALDVLGPEAYAQLVPAFERALAGERVTYESDIPYKNGGARHVHVTFAPRRDTGGEITGVVALVVDLTGRFVDEVALRESEDHYRHAVELNPHTSWTSAPDGQLDHVNSRWLEWTGTSGLGSSYLDGLHPDDRELTLGSWQRSIGTGEPYDVEHRVAMRDGGYRWMHSRAYPRRAEGGRIVKWYGTTEDIHDRKVAETALAEEVAERNAILGQLAEGVIVTDAEGRITFVNEAAARIHGTARLEIGAQDYAQTYRLFTEDGDPYPSHDLPLARAVRGETVTDARWLIRRPDTEVLAVGSARPVRAADGRQIGAVLTLRDDSAREMAEAMVRRSEARYRSLFESIDAGFCVIEVRFEGERAADYRFVEVNPAFERQTGLHNAEGRWAREMLPTLEQHWFDMYGEVARTGTAARFEDHAEAMGRWFDVHAYRVGDPRESRVAILFNDISQRKAAEDALQRELEERRRAEAALRESEARFRLIADSAPVPMWMTRLDRTREFANRAYVDFLGMPYEEALAFDWRHIIHPDDIARMYAEQVANEASLKPFTLEARYRTKDGEYRWIRSESQPRWGPNGEHSGFIGVAYDVTLAKQSEIELQAQVEERTAELRQAQKMEAVGQLTGGIAHDFNNLLTPIMGSLDMLRRRLDPADARAQRTVDTALQATERAATLVQRLLAFARRQDLQARAVDVADLLAGMDDLLARSLGASIRVVVDAPAELSPARVDPNQLELAILNLSINARDAMPAGGALTITAREASLATAEADLKPGRYIRISVADTGVGMDADTVRRAVEPFFSTKGVGKGTGLGLSMVYGFAAQLGGALRLSSAPGVGTTAELWMPVSDEAAPTDAMARKAPRRAAQSANILVVDDEDLVRMGTADMLTDLGYTVVEARSGPEALTLLEGRERDFDLIVTDYLMPDMTGAELAGRVRERRPGLPVLLVTGYTNLAEGAGADLPRLSKPFRQDDLAGQVAELLKG